MSEENREEKPRSPLRILDGDTVVVDGNHKNVALVEGRRGTLVRVRFPYDEFRTDYIDRSRIDSLAELIALACRRGTKFSNALSWKGSSSLGELAAAFGYRAEMRLRRDTLERIGRQLYRAGVEIDADGTSRDTLFELKAIELDRAVPRSASAVPGQPTTIALPDPFWPTALGLPGNDELRFFHALSRNEPILALLVMPERARRATWLRPTWEALLSWAYVGAQRFVRRSEPRDTNDDNVVLVSPAALASYVKPRALQEENRLLDGPRHLNLAVLDIAFDDRDLPRLKALWPGPVFSFAPNWVNEEDPYATPQFCALVQTLALAGGRTLEWTSSALHNVSAVELVVWAKDSARQLLARGATAFGDFLSTTKVGRFRGSNESSTALALKALTVGWLKRRHPEATIAFEVTEDAVAVDDMDETPRTRVDILAKPIGVFEIETLQASGPIEDFYQRKVFSRVARLNGTFHLVVPTDVLLWAGPYLADLADRLKDKLSGQVLVPCVVGSADSAGEIDLLPLAGVRLSRYNVELAPPVGAGLENRETPAVDRRLRLDDIAGYQEIRALLKDEVIWALRNSKIVQGSSRAAGIMFYGPPGCGKSHIARAVAGELDQEARLLGPADFKGLYLGWGQAKIREQFQWLFDDDNRMLVIDEFDAVARSRHTTEMHSDEKADVNELLVQLDKSARLGRLVLCTTNYVRSLDSAVVRSGRFSHFIPVPPPDLESATAIIFYYLLMLGKTYDGNVIGELEVKIPAKDEILTLLSPVFEHRNSTRSWLCNADLQEVVNQTYRRRAREEQAKQREGAPLCIDISARDLSTSMTQARSSISAESMAEFLRDVEQHSNRELYEKLSSRLS